MILKGTLVSQLTAIRAKAMRSKESPSEAGLSWKLSTVMKTWSKALRNLRLGWKFMFQHDKEPKHSRDNATVAHRWWLCQRCPLVTQTERWLKTDEICLERCGNGDSPNLFWQSWRGSAKNYWLKFKKQCSMLNIGPVRSINVYLILSLD